MKKNFTLKQYVLFSWLIAGGIAFVCSIILFLGFGYYSYTKAVDQAKVDLTEKASKAARRLSAELLLAPRGAPEPIRLQLQNEFGVELKIIKLDQLASFPAEKLSARVYIPQLENKFLVEASRDPVGLLEHFHFGLILTCFASISIITIAGLWLQISYLNYHVVRPIESLVQTSTGDKNTCESWPLEIQEISAKLNDSFKEREQVIYSQVARGVIHDIRTLLQSLQVATDLVDEKPSDERLKNLFKVSKSKLPSLLGIITTALDGSREITVKTQANDLTKTLQKSIETNLDAALSKNIAIQFENNFSSVIVAHDSIQLERAFTNILKNAVEATETESSKNKLIRVQLNTLKNNFVEVTIEDSGHGLPERPESVFRLLKSTKAHGSGLGLLVSKKIIEAHGGHLFASHSLDLSGAKFDVQIPIKPVGEVQL